MRTYASIAIVAAAALTAAFLAAGGRPLAALIAALVGGVWLAGQRRGVGWVAALALLVLAALQGWGVLNGLPAAWLLVSLVASLIAADLDGFARRLARAEVADPAATVRAHARWLIAVAGGGLIAGEIALALRTDLGFGWLAALALLGVVALSRVIRRIRTPISQN